MGAVEIIYLICFFLGLGFAVLTAILSGAFGGGMDGGVGADAHVGHGDVGAGDHAGFSPWNPLIISTFLASFGGGGLIAFKYLAMPAYLHVPIATVSGFGIGGAVFWMMAKFFRFAQASSEVKLHDVIGKEAEVTVSIPVNGMGQVAYIAGGRCTGTATSSDNTAIPQGSQVKILKIVGSTFYVERIP